MNKLLLIMTTFLLFLGACSSEETDSSDLELDGTEETVEVKEVTQEAEEVVEEIEEMEEEEFEIEESISPEDERMLRTYIALAMMEKNFEGTATIDYDEENDAITILPTDPDFEGAILLLQTGGLSMDNWYVLRDSYVELSEELGKVVGEGVIISLLNPSNPDRTILTIVDGDVFYDAFD